MRGNWQYLILALVMACTMWFMVSGREEVEAWTTLRIEMKGMPANLIVMNGLEPKVDVRVRAPKGLIRGINERQLAYSIDLSGLSPGLNVIPVLPEKVPLGNAYEVVEMRPSRLTLNVDTIENRQVPVAITVTGALAPDMRVTRATSIPEIVTVRGPSTLLAKIESVPVLAPAPDGAEPGVVEGTGLVDAPDGLEAEPGQVQVTFLLGLKTVQKEISRTIEITAPEGRKVSARSHKVRLQLELPESKSQDAALLDNVQAGLEIPDTIEAGTHALPYRVYLPEGVWLRSAEPSTLTVTIGKR